MKKLYFLLFTLFALTSYAQNLAVNGSFENWTAGVPDGYTTIDFSDTDLTENTNASFVSDGTSSASVNVLTTSQGDTDIRQTIALTGGVTYTMSLDVYATNNQARARIFNGSGFSPSQYSDPDVLNQWQTISFEYTPAADEDFDMGIRFYDISANWVDGSLFYIDNLQVTAAVDPSIAVTSPADGSTVPSADVDVTISVQNFSVAAGGAGDGYIIYSVDGGSFTDKFDTAALNLTGLAEGAHSVDFELVDNSGQSLPTAATASVNFTVSTISQVANIAALRAGTEGDFYELTGEAVISYIVTDNNRNQKYIQDATGGILIDDTAGTLSTAFNIGDGITGLQGQLSAFAGVLQFVPSANVATASSTGNTITPQDVSVTDFLANAENYESELIRITNVTFGVTGVFENNTNYDIADGPDTTVARVSFADEDLVGANIPTMTSSVIGLGAEFNGTYQVLPRYVSDVEGATLSTNDLDSLSFSVYPNPTSTGFVNIVSVNNDETSVAVYDILGKEVMNKTLTNNRLNVASLNTGVYILKISQNNASVTKKLVIK
ncbi:T9SS type A sorting domain-containing protein [Psychroserpens sp. MEBiC05023]